MEIKWHSKRIGDFALVKGGKRLPKGSVLLNQRTSYPYIRLVDIANNRISSSSMMYLDESIQSKIDRYIVQEDDVCLAIVGHTIGLVFYVDKFWNGANLTENAARITPYSQMNSKFLFYYLLSLFGQEQIKARVVGSAQGKLPLYAIQSIEVPIPPISQQKAIADFLSALDDKIELNRQMNETLETIARTLFKSWFVDFDPVRAKMEGRQSFGMDEELAKLFPDSLTDSELGNIPYKWNIKPLSSCVSYLSRGVAPEYVTSSPIRALNQRAIRWGYIDETALKFHDPGNTIREEAYIRRGDVVINSTGDGTIGRAYWFHHNVTNLFADSHVSIARTLPEVLYPELLVFYMETELYQSIIYGHVTGSTGQLELNRSNLSIIPFLCPPIELQKEFSVRIAPWFDLLWKNQEQSRTLTSIRDLLLPKLLSGEIRAKDAEKLVEATV